MSGTILVLPEAFNLESYDLRSNIREYPRMLSDLQQVSEDFDIVIVAGLIIPSPTHHEKPYSSAYLIDANGAELMCHKMLQDSQGPYRPCQTGCDGHNAVKYLNVALCCLVCMDAYERHAPAQQERLRLLKEKMDKLTEVEYRLMCVPAHIEENQPNFWGIPNSYRIVANASNRPEFPKSPGSSVEYMDEQPSPVIRVPDHSPCIGLHPLRPEGS